MKKIFLAAGVALLAACNGSTSSEKNVEGTTTTDTATTHNNAMGTGTSMDTGNTYSTNGTGAATGTTTTTSTTSHQAYSPSEGDVTRRNGKVMVYRKQKWEEPKNDIKGENGITITRTGTVTRNNGQSEQIQEGETVNKSGNFFDKAGNAITKAWDKTKEVGKKFGEDVGEAGKDVGHAVGNTAKKVGGKVKGVVDKDDKKQQ